PRPPPDVIPFLLRQRPDPHPYLRSFPTRRSSDLIHPELLDRDANNILLARQNRFRLEAEVLRDSFLYCSGLLAPKIGGPSIRPPDRKSTRLNSSHDQISYAVFCLTKKQRLLYVEH